MSTKSDLGRGGICLAFGGSAGLQPFHGAPYVALVESYVDRVLNERDVRVIPELFSPDYVDNTPHGAAPSVQGVAQFVDSLNHGWARVVFHLEECFSAGHMVAYRLWATGHRHSWVRLSSAKDTSVITGVAVGMFEVSGDRLASHWGTWKLEYL